MADIVYVYNIPEKVDVSKKIWTDKAGKDFEESYCNACDVKSIKCPFCELGSCSGSGCDYCNDAFTEYLNG